MAEFKKGDVVELVSGGPDMTVTFVGDSEITVHWFGNHNEKSLWDRFPAEALQKVAKK